MKEVITRRGQYPPIKEPPASARADASPIRTFGQAVKRRRLKPADRLSLRPTSAYTLFETVLSLVVITLISLGVAAVMQAAAYGTSSQREWRRVAVRGRQVQARLNDTIRDARAILAVSNTYLVLWTGDSTRNDQVNLSELQLIELTGSPPALVSYTPGSLSSNPTYAPTVNFYTTARSAVTGGQLVGQTWSGHVSNTRFVLDNAAPTAARLVTWSLTFTDQQVSEPIIGCAALHAPGTPQ